ncbi:MAG: hypothetical protein JWL84_1484 [Rhodospirillales bacterium]|jgi:glycosyltransferase involved in cell wall biosynthesis|nr:hypothetical protein [Rhodospirillales bacterium]
MKLLLSAYACAPNEGSEPGIGWNWVREAARLGHEVWALVSPAHQVDVGSVSKVDPLAAAVHWVFPQSRWSPLPPDVLPRRIRLYNLLWQAAALEAARQLHRRVGFDAVHHVTWGGIRDPTFLGRLGVPSILGPLGGGERAPMRLRDAFHLRGQLADGLRDVANATVWVNPLLRRSFREAAVIFAKTEESRQLVPRRWQEKTLVMSELAIHAGEIGRPRGVMPRGPQLLFVGRLLYWKGAHLAIAALDKLRRDVPTAHLTIVGRGPEEQRLKADVAKRRLGAGVTFLPWLDQQILFDTYSRHDLLLFPSLHDSSGNVVLEALGRGLPVICTDRGGPKEFVTSECGRVISTVTGGSVQFAAAAAAAIANITRTPGCLAALSDGALRQARRFLWHERVALLYGLAQPYLAAARKPPRAADKLRLGASING